MKECPDYSKSRLYHHLKENLTLCGGHNGFCNSCQVPVKLCEVCGFCKDNDNFKKQHNAMLCKPSPIRILHRATGKRKGYDAASDGMAAAKMKKKLLEIALPFKVELLNSSAEL
jgi:hypothetical protein